LYSKVAEAAESRPTSDVDCLVEVTPRLAYYALEEELRAPGFRHDREAPVICAGGSKG
jgi:hypothetical protein